MHEMYTMLRGFASGALIMAALFIPVPITAQQAAAGKTYTFAGETLRGYQNVQSNLAAAAEKSSESTR